MVRDRREYNKEYYLKNREKALVERKKYYEENKEEVKNNNKEYEKNFIKTPKGKYSIQKRKATRRGIEWELTFEEWFKIWQDSGKWDFRGCNKNQYVMCRTGDIGSYSKDNVFIDTNSNNSLALNLKRDSYGRFLPNETSI